MKTRRRKRREDVQARALEWVLAARQWSEQHPGVPVMEAVITRDGSDVRWNGPHPGAGYGHTNGGAE